jgi:hypothetical protein
MNCVFHLLIFWYLQIWFVGDAVADILIAVAMCFLVGIIVYEVLYF